jgi:signal transduction histidine kinase
MRKPSDYVLAALFTVGGILLMVANLSVDDDSSLAHPVSTQSWLILPVFLFVTVPILWRRRNILAGLAVTVAAMAVHVLAFGWLTRCGLALPLAAALAYAVARFAGGVRQQLIGLAGVVALILLTLARDSSIGGLPAGLEVALPGAALFYGIGLAVNNRVARKQLVAA